MEANEKLNLLMDSLASGRTSILLTDDSGNHKEVSAARFAGPLLSSFPESTPFKRADVIKALAANLPIHESSPNGRALPISHLIVSRTLNDEELTSYIVRSVNANNLQDAEQLPTVLSQLISFGNYSAANAFIDAMNVEGISKYKELDYTSAIHTSFQHISQLGSVTSSAAQDMAVNVLNKVSWDPDASYPKGVPAVATTLLENTEKQGLQGLYDFFLRYEANRVKDDMGVSSQEATAAAGMSWDSKGAM